jgi:hypothetical protein
MRKMMKFYAVPALVVATYSASAAAVDMDVVPMAEGGVLAAITMSVAAGIWLARRKR